MSLCKFCAGKGIVLVCYVRDRTYDACACLCDAGKWFRQPWALRAWASRQPVTPGRVLRLEEVYSDKGLEELRTALDLDQDIGGPPTAEDFDAKAG